MMYNNGNRSDHFITLGVFCPSVSENKITLSLAGLALDRP
jgi:hypothetical protein